MLIQVGVDKNCKSFQISHRTAWHRQAHLLVILNIIYIFRALKRKNMFITN